MATHDYVIDNQSAPALRADLNSVLQAIVSTNAAASAPATTYANMLWYDTAANTLKKRNEANSGWITIGTFDEGTGTFTPEGLVIASQAEAEAGTNNTKLTTPLRVAQAIAALAQTATPFKNFQAFAASGTWAVPAGVTSAYVIVVGGGCGGAEVSGSNRGGTAGGLAANVLSVSGSIAVTVGAGSAGSNGGSVVAAGSSSFSTLSATGGQPTADGVGSGSGVLSDASLFTLAVAVAMPNAILTTAFPTLAQRSARPRAASSTAALAYSLTGAYTPGAAGSSESGSSPGNSDATGGVGGAVFIFW